MTSERRKASVESLVATFSAHVRENFPPPGKFRPNLDRMLESKKDRLDPVAYVESLEKNRVYLRDLVERGEAYLRSLLDRANERDPTAADIAARIERIQREARDSTARSREEMLSGEAGPGEELARLRREDRDSYVERLEFDYTYMMSVRMFLFEFFNVLAAVRNEYEIEGVDESSFDLVRNSIEMTANLYLGNVMVGEAGKGDEGLESG